MKEKKCRDFSAEEVVRAAVLDGAIRTSDLLTGVSASSTAAAARDGVERLQRLLSRAQTVAVTREVMMSEWRRQSRIGFWFDANVAWVEPAATIMACSTCAHRGLCAMVRSVPMGCTRLAVFATNMAEPAQEATSSQVCSISITAFAADPRCCAGFVYGFPAGCRVPTPGAANV